MKTDLNKQLSPKKYAEAMEILTRGIQKLPPAKQRELFQAVKSSKKQGA